MAEVLLEVEVGSPAVLHIFKEGTPDEKRFWRVGIIIHGGNLFGLPLPCIMGCDAAFDVAPGVKGQMPIGEIFVTDERRSLSVKPYLRANRDWFRSKSGLSAKAAAA